MGNSLSELASYFQPLALRLIEGCAAIGVDVRVIDTGRTPKEQQQKLLTKVSWTLVSKHEPQPPEMKSEAIDIAPIKILDEGREDWDPTNPLWEQIGHVGESLGLRWGGRWKHHPDPSHFEYQPTAKSTLRTV